MPSGEGGDGCWGKRPRAGTKQCYRAGLRREVRPHGRAAPRVCKGRAVEGCWGGTGRPTGFCSGVSRSSGTSVQGRIATWVRFLPMSSRRGSLLPPLRAPCPRARPEGFCLGCVCRTSRLLRSPWGEKCDLSGGADPLGRRRVSQAGFPSTGEPLISYSLLGHQTLKNREGLSMTTQMGSRRRPDQLPLNAWAPADLSAPFSARRCCRFPRNSDSWWS